MSAYRNAGMDHRRKVDELLADTAANGGLAPLDIEQFWVDQDRAAKDPFGVDIAQVPLGRLATWECVFDELGEPQNWRRFLFDDPLGALELCKRYNDKAEKIVGRRMLGEVEPDPERQWPEIKALYDIFEAENVWHGGDNGSWWLMQAVDTPRELSALLDRVERRIENLREFMLPENWDNEKKRLLALGCQVPLYRGQRGPCTFACSIYGAENMLLLYYDDPGLMRRFSDVLARAILARARVLDEEAGQEAAGRARSWSWADDNSCLFSPEMYECFAMPIHRKVFGHYAPAKSDSRYQHSDSDMAHLLPLLAELDLTGTNFGPTVMVSEIRRYLPRAIIHGQMAPFTYSRNEEANMVAEFLRDFQQIRPTRGLSFTTAGSINNGSRLSGMRLLMAAAQRYGRY